MLNVTIPGRDQQKGFCRGTSPSWPAPPGPLSIVQDAPRQFAQHGTGEDLSAWTKFPLVPILAEMYFPQVGPSLGWLKSYRRLVCTGELITNWGAPLPKDNLDSKAQQNSPFASMDKKVVVGSQRGPKGWTEELLHSTMDTLLEIL